MVDDRKRQDGEAQGQNIRPQYLERIRPAMEDPKTHNR
jgi:hypothetical protein